MKKIMLFAAACVALAACNKEIDTTTREIGDAVSFEKGQQVSLTANAPAATKVTGSLNATTDAVDFKWETGDKIKVTVGTESAEFTLSSGAGTASATFTGTMPAGGNSFNVQYPVTDPDLSTQTYVADGLPKDKMKMTATGCTIDKPFSLTAQNAALRLNLYGLNREVSSIVVTNTTANPNVSYTLNCSAAVRVGNSVETATPFLLVIPAGASEWKFKVEVTAGNATANLDSVPTYTEGSYEGSGIVITTGTFSTSSAKTFTAGQTLNMPAKLISAVWAPVNCGYDADHLCGKLYQWGRMDGSGYYKDAKTTTPAQDASDKVIQTNVVDLKQGTYTTSNPASDTFYYNPNKSTNGSCDWYTSLKDSQFSSWPMTAPSNTSRIGNPCPSGWRVPTSDELGNLVYSDWDSSTQKGSTKRTYTFSSGYVTINGLTLPAAGSRSYKDGNFYDRGSYGNYWSSTVRDRDARNLYFLISSEVGMYRNYRADAYSVRCVQE